jgi:hypothetical protein
VPNPPCIEGIGLECSGKGPGQSFCSFSDGETCTCGQECIAGSVCKDAPDLCEARKLESEDFIIGESNKKKHRTLKSNKKQRMLKRSKKTSGKKRSAPVTVEETLICVPNVP